VGRVAGDLELLSSSWMRGRRRWGRDPWQSQQRGRATSSSPPVGSAASIAPIATVVPSIIAAAVAREEGDGLLFSHRFGIVTTGVMEIFSNPVERGV
jgi:hypothetical protein